MVTKKVNEMQSEQRSESSQDHDISVYEAFATVREKHRTDCVGQQVEIGGHSIKSGEIEGVLAQHSMVQLPPLLPRARGGQLPLSLAQERLWFLHQRETNTAFYNVPAAVHLTGRLEMTALENSLTAIVQRHEVLRATFTTVEGHPVQVVAPTPSIPLTMVDLTRLAKPTQEAEVRRLAIKEAEQPFDLAQGPLIRARLLRLSETEHVFLLTLHHMVSDNWSISVFIRELAAFYEAFSSGKPSPLPELQVQYADFAAWQREWLRDEVIETQLAYWHQQLSGVPTALELPTDHPRTVWQTSRGARQTFQLSQALTEGLKRLSREDGVSLFTTLLAAFQTLLHRYTGQEDILVGSPIANRTQPETEKLIGFFTNTLVLRSDLSGNPTFREVLARVREVIVAAYAHQNLPFLQVVETLQLQQDPSCTPLIQVMFVLENALLLPLDTEGLQLGPMEVDSGTTRFELTLSMADTDYGLRGVVEYNTDLFEATTISRMLGHFQTLLEGIVADPSQPVVELPLLTAAERHQLLVEWNNTATDYPRDQCIHQLFEAQVERTPESVAVVFADRQLTYQELNSRANQLAHHLRQLGVGPEIVVGLYIERSLEMIVGLLGILKAGAAYMPLVPAYPQDRLAFMLQEAQVTVLLTQQRLVENLPDHEAKVVCLDTGWEAIARESTENPFSEMATNNLAYVIYTSGSTGKPKGVLVTQQNLVHSTYARMAYYQPPVKSCLLLHSFAFDASVGAIFWTLCQGGRLILLEQDLEQDPSQIAGMIAHSQISHMLFPSSLYSLVVAQAKPGQLMSLQLVIVGGDSCPKELVERHSALLPHTTLFNEYGPTEATVWSSVYEIRCQSLGATVPIGRPIANAHIYLLDRHLHPVPIGVPGELYIGGAGLVRGYLNRPELTAERFIPHPFSDEPGTRLYKTGDLARYLSDGNIEFLGRVDHQVKIRGFRIELGEIEAVLSKHPAVQEAVVIAREDMPGHKRLVAYIVQNLQAQNLNKLISEMEVSKEPTSRLPGQTVQSKPGSYSTNNLLQREFAQQIVPALRHFLKEKLPDYMMPSAFVLLESLPLTSNGKVDRRALPAPEQTGRMTEEPFVAPRLMVHHQLKAIWEELLDVRPIGIRDNFFYLGGDSLLAARLVDRIEQVFRKKLSLSTLFTAPTIEELADVLSREEDSETHSRTPLVAVQLGKSRRPFFFFNGDGYGGAFYCFTLARALGTDQPFYVLEPHRYQFDDLQALPSFEAIVAAHMESLRTIQPQGPYLLGGFCGGGLVAFELARQLHREGQAVDLLVLIEPGVASTRLRWSRSFISRIANLLRLRPDKQLDWFLHLRHLAKFLLYSSYRELPNVSLFPTTQALRQDGSNILPWVVAPYIPREYPGKVTFLWASEEPYRRVEWLKVAKEEGEVHFLPGTHLSLLTKHLPDLAQHLKKCLSEARADRLCK